MLRNLLSTFFALILFVPFAMAQTGQGALKGKILDKETGEPLPFVNIVVELNGVMKSGGTTDFDGKYFIKPLTPGKYTVKATFTGYKPIQINGVVVGGDKIEFLDVKMESSVEQLEEFVVVEYKVPLISKDNTTSGSTITKEDLVRMPGRSATAVAQTVGGVYSSDNGNGELNIRGARSDANYYYIDGIKVRGSNTMPQSAIEEVAVLTGGIPAQYGDVTGGVISITTRGPSSEYSGSAEYVTSGYKFGDKVYGLDKFGYNLFEGSVTGPLLMKKDSNGKKSEPLMGFFLSANVTSEVDTRPMAIGNYRIKEDVRKEIVSNPLRYDATAGTLLNAEFLRTNSFEKIATRDNANRNRITLNGKIDINTGKNTNLTIGGTYDWRKSREYRYDFSLLNSKNNPEVIRSTWRTFARFTQRFGSGNASTDEKSSSVIKNAYYSIQADYSQDNYKRWDKEHKDDYFKYGYVGEFKRFRQRVYTDAPTTDTIWYNDQHFVVTQGYFQTTTADTLIGFKAADINPEAAQYTSNYYKIFGWKGYDENGNPIFDKNLATYGRNGSQFRGDNFYLSRMQNIQQNGGLANGDVIRDIYQIWRGAGRRWNTSDIVNRNQFRISAMGSADVKDHAISLGFEYEQRVDRGYSVYPTQLWQQGNLLVNKHILELDKKNPTVVYEGTYPKVSYEQLNSSPGKYKGDSNDDTQSFLDYNIRKALGWNPDGTQFIDFNSLDPTFLNIRYFSADELLRGGSELVSYYGYDVYGRKLNSTPTLDDFFTKVDEFGNYARPIGAFRPNYVAGWIQDKFSYDDLVFNVGLRIDRYDANQEVLKDKYVLFPTVKAGEAEAMKLAGEKGHPGNIGNDYVVYVDNVKNPTSISGYRNGDKWFNKEGVEIDNPDALKTSSGSVAPLLVDKEKVDSKDISSAAFKDYDPQINFMPRVAFSFPVSDEALFFAHYDVLTKRPTAGGLLSNGTRLNPLDYLFLQQRTASDRIPNPDLKPEKTIDYALGFKQKITNSSSVSLEAFYREMRDQVQTIGVVQAFPKTYTTYGNIDFGTVKGLTFSYDMRKTGNLWMKASYTLQFADGTGSDELGAVNLVAAGKQNLRTTIPLSYDQRHTIVTTVDYRYGKGKDYNGPIIAGMQVLQNTGVNFQFNMGSGTPYSKQSLVTREGQLTGRGSAILDGTINGSRLPWQFRLDMRIDKDFELKIGEDKKPLQMTVYLQMLNVLNSLNINRVYQFTGSATDDGTLTDPTFQNDIAGSNDEQSYREYYTMKINNPFYFDLPRRTRIGVAVNF